MTQSDVNACHLAVTIRNVLPSAETQRLAFYMKEVCLHSRIRRLYDNVNIGAVLVYTIHLRDSKQ